MRLTLSKKLVFVFICATLLTWAVTMAAGYIYVEQILPESARIAPGSEIMPAERHDLSAVLLYSLSAVALIMLIGSVYICRTLMPIKKCVAFAEAVAKGDNLDLDVYRSDCLGHLAEALRIMVGKLRSQAHWYESILNALPYGISVTDMDMRWTFWQHSRAQRHGQDRHERGARPALFRKKRQYL